MRNPRTTPSMSEFSKLLDQNPNLQLLFARTTDKLLQNFIHKNFVYNKIHS